VVAGDFLLRDVRGLDLVLGVFFAMPEIKPLLPGRQCQSSLRRGGSRNTWPMDQVAPAVDFASFGDSHLNHLSDEYACFSGSGTLITGAGKHIYRSLEDQTPIITDMETKLSVTRLEFNILDALDRLKIELHGRSTCTTVDAEIVRAILRGVVFAEVNIRGCRLPAELEMQIRSRLESTRHSRQPNTGLSLKRIGAKKMSVDSRGNTYDVPCSRDR
jgi:hypothetical protein